MDKKNRTISDLLGNEYYLQEETDIKGKYLEVYEVVTIDNVKHKTYLLDMDMDMMLFDEDVESMPSDENDLSGLTWRTPLDVSAAKICGVMGYS